MNPDEEIAFEVLKNLGCKEIHYEPLGKNKAPDFLIENNIGVEVRRLNRQVNLNGSSEPIEQLQYKLLPKFNRILDDLNDPLYPYSFRVSLNFQRPINLADKLLSNALKSSLNDSTKNERFEEEIFINSNLSYVLFRDHVRGSRTYQLTSFFDYDQSGHVQDARYHSLMISIREKEDKVQNLLNHFSVLWLILIDHIYSRVDYTTKEFFRYYPKIDSIFERILLVSGQTKYWIDIYPW